MEEKDKFNVAIDHGEAVFFSDNVTVSHNQNKFIIDFSQTTPRFDNIAGNMQQSLIIKHKTIMVEPQFAKIIMDLLDKNLKKYENAFGKIDLPKVKKKRKAKIDKSKIDTKSIAEKATRYIG